MRQTVVYSCVHHLWRSLSAFSEDQVPTCTGEGHDEGDLELQLLAAMLALSARSFLKQEQSTIKKKRLKQSTVELSRGLDCSSCGPLSPQSAHPAESEVSSEVTVGYVSISPSPSELALPNTIYSSRDNLLDGDDVEFSPILEKLPYSSLVILREALLPFYIVSGLQVNPQLRTLCHNSAEYFLDLTVEIREVTIFVCENTDAKPSAPSPAFSHFSGSPSLMGEQLAISGLVKYLTGPQLGRARQSQRITLLKPSVYHVDDDGDSNQDNAENKTNISCKCCVSLDNLSSTVTTPLLKLSRHMAETARFRAKVRKQAKIRADELVATPRPPLDEDGEQMVQILVEDARTQVQQTVTEMFAQDLVRQFMSMEQDIFPPSGEQGNATPTSTSGSGMNIKIFEYARSPKVSKSRTATSSAAEQEPAKLSIPVGYTLSDSSGGPVRYTRQRRTSTTSNTSNTSGEVQDNVAITIEGVDTPPDLTQNNTSPEEVLSTQDTYGDDTTDLLSSDVEGGVPAKSTKHHVTVKSHTKDPPSVPTSGGHSPIKVFSLSEGELLYSIFGLLRINTVSCEVQIDTTRLSLELNAISAAVDVRKSLPQSRPQQRSPSVDELDQLLHFDLLPTYMSVSATLRRSLVRITDRGLPDNDILLFSALPVYGSVGVCNHTHQKLPTYRCLLKFAGLELDIKQSPVKVHRRYQQLLPTFTKIYNDVFASSSEGASLDPSLFTPTDTTPNVAKVTEIKLPSQLPKGVIHFKIDKTQLIMAPLPSLTVTYTVSIP